MCLYVFDSQNKVLLFVEQPCLLKNMKDGGVVPKDKLSVTKMTPPGSTILLVKSPSLSATTPTWMSLTFTSAEVKKITVTPFDKSGAQLGAPKEETTDGKKTPLTVTLDHPTEADHLIVVLAWLKPSEETKVDLLSVVSCMPDEGMHDDHLQ